LDTKKIAITNQKLLSMKLHLLLSQQVLAEGEDSSVQRAYAQSLSFHFQLTYVAFMQEIAADYRIDSTSVDSFTQLEENLDKLDIVCQQCSMLAELESDSSSWLSFMLRSYQSCWPGKVSAASSNKSDGAENSLIQFFDVTEQSSSSQYQQSYQQLYSLIHQYRELMQEW